MLVCWGSWKPSPIVWEWDTPSAASIAYCTHPAVPRSQQGLCSGRQSGEGHGRWSLQDLVQILSRPHDEATRSLTSSLVRRVQAPAHICFTAGLGSVAVAVLSEGSWSSAWPSLVSLFSLCPARDLLSVTHAGGPAVACISWLQSALPQGEMLVKCVQC